MEYELWDALTRSDFSVITEILERIAEEVIYEPHGGRRRTHPTKLATVVYFVSGARWRVPYVGTHYKWSKVYDMGASGLDHTSIVGDSFYIVRLREDDEVAYTYNKKMFDLALKKGEA